MAGVLLLGALVAQAVTAASPDAAELQRIRSALAEPPAIVISDAFDKPVFRVTIRGKRDGPVWAERPAVRPGMPLYHFEYLQMVTPEAFRASTLYPAAYGIPIGSFIDALIKDIRDKRRKRAEARARAEVTDALQEVLACRADPTKPGC